MGNEALNARGFFGAEGRARRNDFGAFIGGPLRKHRTFFSYHYDRLVQRSGPESGFANSTPVRAFRRGDFSRLAGPSVVGADALGRVLRHGQVFDPASTRTVRGVPVRDPFPNNLIPAGHPSLSRVAAEVVPLLAQPQRSGLELNAQGRAFGSQVGWREAPAHMGRIEHAFSEALRTTFTYSRTSHKSVRNCGGVGGCRTAHDPRTRPEGNAGYLGEGFVEEVLTRHARQSFDWAVFRNLLSHTAVTFSGFRMAGHSLSAGAGWVERLWGSGGNGLLALDAGPPALRFIGNTQYSPLGNSWGRSGSAADRRYQVSHALLWVSDRHTVKVGVEYRHRRYPFRGWAANVAGSFAFHRLQTGGFDARGNNLASTGDPFASFLLGQVHSTHFQIPDFPTLAEDHVAWSVVEQYRVARRLTLTVGLRFDYQTAIRERHDNMSTFDPKTPNPGADGRGGAMIFAGRGRGRTGFRTLEDPPRDGFGPRVGFAYRMGESNVVRGGYGIFYAGVPHSGFDVVNTFGFRSVPTAVDLSNGRRPAYFLDDGFPRENIVPPSLDPAIGNNTSPAAITRDRVTLPRVQDWTFAVQRQVTRSVTVDLSYAGNRGTRLVADRGVLGPAANANDPAVLALGPSQLASAVGSGAHGAAMPYRGFRHSVAQSLRPFPQVFNIGYLNVPVGNSFYHALRTKIEKRFSEGAHFRAIYAWSKLTGMGAGASRRRDGFGHGPQNPIDTQSLERGLSAEDVPHRLLAAFTHALPLFRERTQGLAAKVLGGWAVSSLLRFEGAQPVNIVMANDLAPFLFNGQKRPDIVRSRVRLDPGSEFDAARDAFFDRAAFADPGPLRFGTASRTMSFVRGFPHVAEDVSLFKDTWISEAFKLRLEARFGNIFNRVVFCDPNRNWSSASFGRAFAQCNSPRSIQFGLRFDF